MNIIIGANLEILEKSKHRETLTDTSRIATTDLSEITNRTTA